MADQNNPQPRPQQSSYPSPHSYPSPSLQPTYAYPPPQGQQAAEPYRASPTSSNMSLPSLNLPPIRSIDGQVSQPQQPAQPGQPTMGSPLPPPVAPMSAYYPHPSQTLPPPGQHLNVTSSPHNMGMRYPLPAQVADERMISSGRHKKEIKRRTKTGCLTCRKRRIKCDEEHPVCRNCRKSKRECLGYDPIFKQQPGPAQIQPAPSAAPASSSSTATASAASPSYQNVPQGYVPAVSAGYTPALGAAPISSSGATADPSYQLEAAIDPALAGADSSTMAMSQPSDGSSNKLRPDVKAVLGSASPYSSTASEALGLKAKKVTIDDLLSLGGIVPPPVPSGLKVEPSMYDEIKILYTKDYAPGIDKMLETTWHSTKGLGRLLSDSRLCEMFANLVEQFRSVGSNDYEGMRRLPSLEARLVWNLMCLCRSANVSPVNGSNAAAPKTDEEEGLTETRKRLDVFEHLVTGQVAESNPVQTLRYPGTLPPTKLYEIEFWRLLGQYVSLRDTDPNNAKEVDNTLNSCRNILGQLENRDVLYSMAIARHFGARLADFPEGPQQAYSNDDSDVRTKVFIAKKFIEDEASGKGTTQVIQRLCGMAVRSWSALR